MANSKFRCAGCKQSFRQSEMFRQVGLSRVCSPECLAAVAAGQSLSRSSQPARTARTARSGRKTNGGSSRRSRGLRTPLNVRSEVLDRDLERCRFCGSGAGIHVHHITYRSEGGGHEPSNLICLCAGPGTRNCHDRVHSDKRWWQPILRACIWLGYVEGRQLSVPQAEREVAELHPWAEYRAA